MLDGGLWRLPGACLPFGANHRHCKCEPLNQTRSSSFGAAILFANFNATIFYVMKKRRLVNYIFSEFFLMGSRSRFWGLSEKSFLGICIINHGNLSNLTKINKSMLAVGYCKKIFNFRAKTHSQRTFYLTSFRLFFEKFDNFRILFGFIPVFRG